MDYYFQQKDEKSAKIRILHKEADKILEKLNQIQVENNLDSHSILPIYDFVIDFILSGGTIEADELDNYYKLYSKSMTMGFNLLSYVLEAFRYEITTSFLGLISTLPWHSRLWIRIKNFIRI